MSEEKVEVETPVYTDEVMRELSKIVGPDRVSNMELERIVYSGDPSALPQFHYRWKRKYLADYIVRVKTAEEIKGVMRVASSHKISVIPRGGASSCLGSSSPSRGGISLDIKRMDNILEVNAQDMYVRVEPGVPFERLEIELAKSDVTLGIYPSSAKSAVIGGWIGCGGGAGIGTPHCGHLFENVLELTVVRADGEVVKVAGDEIGLFVGSYGILGVISEAKLKIHKKPNGFIPFSYAFDHLEHLCNAMRNIAQLDQRPVHLKIADKDFQSYSNPLEKGKYVLTAVYIQDPQLIPIDEFKMVMADNGGVDLGVEYAAHEWTLRYDCEFNPKEHCETLMFQEVWADVDKVYDILKQYESYKESHKVPAIWFGMLGTPGWMRVELMAMLNPDHYLKFIASKGILHKMVKKSIALDGGPYTIGLQNSIYMKRAYPERQLELQDAKSKWDPENIMNPDRVTSCMTSHTRMNILFVLAAAIRRLSRYVGR
ncbi:MAG: FAD-binding oxidoreductase [Candidatus Thorarchaeota archaeon]|jgi:FAD/FMN-containing dehydrogenase